MSLYKMPQLCTYSRRSIILGLGTAWARQGCGYHARKTDNAVTVIVSDDSKQSELEVTCLLGF